ncbi:hypothetical protein PVL29_023262 [Vitis rotundifolia]|uniref:Uncharacterized protein n=1 Tax=Vitis rotundifolia TaxID=103349 RepID=A0AA38YND9_VITRO|nr:hypothetical protein PVL29_023262 [Vitis rotundifolia]
MADDTPSTTTPFLRLSRRWFSSICLKTTLSAELGGSVGDLGTYIPIVLTLTLVNHLDLSTTLIFTALYNISTSFLFGIPMPVQPHEVHRCRLFWRKIRPLRNWLDLDGFALAIFSILLLVLVTGYGDFGDEVIPLGVHEEENDFVNYSCRRVRRRLQIMSSILAALIVFILGLVLCFIPDPSIVKDLQFGPSRSIWEDWKIGFFL